VHEVIQKMHLLPQHFSVWGISLPSCRCGHQNSM